MGYYFLSNLRTLTIKYLVSTVTNVLIFLFQCCVVIRSCVTSLDTKVEGNCTGGIFTPQANAAAAVTP